jgi:hypothetical protein
LSAYNRCTWPSQLSFFISLLLFLQVNRLDTFLQHRSLMDTLFLFTSSI